jgi:hypothetical protein
MASRIRSGSGGLDSAATKVARREGDVDAATAANGSEVGTPLPTLPILGLSRVLHRVFIRV